MHRYVMLFLPVAVLREEAIAVCHACKCNVSLAPGQMLTSIRLLSTRLCIPKTSMGRILDFLKVHGYISMDSHIGKSTLGQGAGQGAGQGNLKGCLSVISLFNWEKYQYQNDEKTEGGTRGGTRGGPETIYKKNKEYIYYNINSLDNINNNQLELGLQSTEQKQDDAVEPLVLSTIEIAEHLRSAILDYHPKHKLSTLKPSQWKKTRRTWCETIRLMLESDERSVEDMKTIIDFAFDVEFWASKIQTPKSLRKNFDQLAMQMKGKKKLRRGEVDFDEPSRW